jgi:hypothetical protein
MRHWRRLLIRLYASTALMATAGHVIANSSSAGQPSAIPVASSA